MFRQLLDTCYNTCSTDEKRTQIFWRHLFFTYLAWRGGWSSELMCPSPSWSLSNIKRCMKYTETQMQRLKWRLAKAKWRLSKAKARHSSEGKGKKDLSRPKSRRTFDDKLHEKHSRMFPRKEDSLLPSKEYICLLGTTSFDQQESTHPEFWKGTATSDDLSFEFNGVDGVSIMVMGELTNSSLSLLKITYSLQVYTDLDRRSRLIDGGHGLGDALFSFAQLVLSWKECFNGAACTIWEKSPRSHWSMRLLLISQMQTKEF